VTKKLKGGVKDFLYVKIHIYPFREKGSLPTGIALLLTWRGLHLLEERRDPAVLHRSTCKWSWRRVGAYCE